MLEQFLVELPLHHKGVGIMPNMFKSVLSGGSMTLTVTCNAAFAGSTITATDGTSTLTQTCPSVSPYIVIFRLPNSGTWTISGITSGVSYSTTVDVLDATTLNPVPDGSTVTPTDDIQIWLHCADIFDKSYTTIGEVLADSSTLSALIADSNAVDYMVRSTTWATDVCSNQTAMSYIGLDDYCADTLLGDSTWLNAICNSTYFESVLNVKVPTMTSNTTPSGLCSAYRNNSVAFTAFAGTGGYGTSSATNTNDYVQYQFNSPIIPKKVYTSRKSGSLSDTGSLAFKASNDGTNWVTLATITWSSAEVSKNYILNNNDAYTYVRWQSLVSSSNYWKIFAANVYGREPI